MKKIIIRPKFFAIFLLFLTSALYGQNKEVNQNCTSDVECQSGYCIQLRNGEQVCATCSQSEFNYLAPKVDEYCKSFGQGWKPEISSEYNQSLASDGRVQVEVYDLMIEAAKNCRDARSKLTVECFYNGERYDKYDHKGQLEAIERSIQSIADHKYKMISSKRVYYCSKSTYASRLNSFNSKCNLNFPNINLQLDVMRNEFNKGTKVDCDDIDDYYDDCKECYDRAKDLLSDGYSNSDSKFPNDYSAILNTAKATYEKAYNLLQEIKSKSLCD